jgi:predicted dehydrogenase
MTIPRARLGMGLVGPGFVGAHHIDAVRRLGFVDIVAVAASSESSAARKAEALGVPRSYGSYEALAADPDVHVVHNTTPNHLHTPVIMAAIAHGKHIVSDKPLAVTAPEARALWNAAERAGVVHAVTFNYRGNPLVEQARAMIGGRELGPIHFIHGSYLQDWLLHATDFSWRLEPDKGGASSAIGDIGSHWCDLVQHVTGLRIVEVLADLTTVIKKRYKPAESTEAFSTDAASGSRRTPDPGRTEVSIASEDLATVLVRFENGAKGCVTVGQVCAGHKNDLWFEANGQHGSLRWHQERQNELWLGRRDGPNGVLQKDPSLLLPPARAYARLPGGHQEAWADAFRNVMSDIYTYIADGHRSTARAPVFPTFEDGYRGACIVDSILESHRRGGVWTTVAYEALAETR